MKRQKHKCIVNECCGVVDISNQHGIWVNGQIVHTYHCTSCGILHTEDILLFVGSHGENVFFVMGLYKRRSQLEAQNEM